MALVRMLITSLPTAASPADLGIVNTLYFNVSGSLDAPGYQGLVNDLGAIWITTPWAAGRSLNIRAYDMGDAKPRPIKAQYNAQVGGTAPTGPPQVALALSYFADRNLPSQRGRIFTGPWNAVTPNATTAQTTVLINLAGQLAGLGGLNVDWSLYSPKLGTNTRISNAWVDDSWDIIRSRKLPSSAARRTWTGNG